MLTTRRYEYCRTDQIRFHPTVGNHRALSESKIAHLTKDIVSNGLLEPLVVWERNNGEYFLVGGFHRYEAIKRIRQNNPGYFDQVDIRVVAGDPDEIRALNLKLNADRLDIKITDYFETVLHLSNVNWSHDRIAEFLDKRVDWIGEIVQFAPMVTAPMKEKLSSGELSWNRVKEIIRLSLAAPAGDEKKTVDDELARNKARVEKPLSFRNAISHFTQVVAEAPKKSYSIRADDLLSLILVLQGRKYDEERLGRVRELFPELLSN